MRMSRILLGGVAGCFLAFAGLGLSQQKEGKESVMEVLETQPEEPAKTVEKSEEEWEGGVDSGAVPDSEGVWHGARFWEGVRRIQETGIRKICLCWLRCRVVFLEGEV